MIAAVDSSWSWAPGPLLLCGLLLVVYGVRFRRARRDGGSRGASWGRAISWLLGVAALVAALISPIDTLADQVLTMHMIQHLLLLDVAPILLTLGLTKVLLRPVARTVLDIERALGPIAKPWFAVVAYIAAMWFWHVPALYNAALSSSGVHVLEHVVFMVAGTLYWWHLLSPVRGHRMTGMTPVIYMVVTKIGVGLLGIALTFAPKAIYEFYEHQPQVWGLSPVVDQSIAGALMALEQTLVMGVALAFLVIRGLAEAERQNLREDAAADRLAAQQHAGRLAAQQAPAGHVPRPVDRDVALDHDAGAERDVTAHAQPLASDQRGGA